MNQRLDSEVSLYPIGAVAALTGLSANTIRAWERRYQAVVPQRTQGGGRRYSDRDVHRLQLLQQLNEQGCSISTVASLDDEQLRRRAGQLQVHAEIEATDDVSVALVHATLGKQIERLDAGLNVVVDVRSIDELEERCMLTSQIDVLVVDIELLGDRSESNLERMLEASGAAHAVVLYQFARRRRLSHLATLGARLVRGPIPTSALIDVVRQQASLSKPRRASSGREQTRYSPEQIAQLREIKSSVECECPNHLASLLTSLTAFERYAADCESKSAEDRDLHHTLRVRTREARIVMEDLLEMVCAHDGIDL